MAEKDPAFLFYSLNWLQGTAGLKPDEKGVYIDLLSHQHQNGFIPNDPSRLCRMVGLSEKEFLPIWLTVRFKFTTRSDNRLVNLKLETVMTERSTKRATTDHTKAILSRYAVLARNLKKSAPPILEKIKQEFKISDFEHFTIEEATAQLNIWFTNQIAKWSTVWLPTRVENENTDQNRLKDDEGGTGEEEAGREGFSGSGPPTSLPPTTPLPGEMLELYVKAFPEYPMQEVKDYTACMQLGYQIADLNGWTWESANNGRLPEALGKWKEIVAWIPTSTWFRTKSLSFLNDKFQDLIQAKNNGTSQVNAAGAKLGTSDARTEKAKQWGT